MDLEKIIMWQIIFYTLFVMYTVFVWYLTYHLINFLNPFKK